MDLLELLRQKLMGQDPTQATAGQLPPLGPPPSSPAPAYDNSLVGAKPGVVTGPSDTGGGFSGVLSSIGKSLSSAYDTYQNALLGPGSEGLTPEQRSAALWRGRLAGLAAGLSRPGGNAGLAIGARLAGTEQAAQGSLAEQKQKAWEAYLDTRINQSTNPAERDWLSAMRRSGQYIPPPKMFSPQVRSRVTTNDKGQQRDELYDARTGAMVSAGEWHAPVKKTGEPTVADQAKALRILGNREDFINMPTPDVMRLLSPMAAGPQAESIREAIGAYPGETPAEYAKFKARWNAKIHAAPPAPAPEGPGILGQAVDAVRGYFSPDQNQSVAPQSSGPDPLATKINQWKQGQYNVGRPAPAPAPAVAPPAPVVGQPPMTMEEYKQFQADQWDREHAAHLKAINKNRNKNLFGVDVGP